MVEQHGPEAVAHRGDSWTHPENTLAAVASAIARGADVVEIDIRFTADRVPVVLHDMTLNRCWDLDRRVNSMTAAEIAMVRRGEHRIPTVVEALDLFIDSSVRVLVDLPDADGIAVLVEICRSHAVADQIIWCGDATALAGVRALWADAVLYAAPQVNGLDPAMVNVDASTITSADIAEFHAAGRRVSVWTVNTAPAMRQLIMAGADSITTDRLDLLLAVRDELATVSTRSNVGQAASDAGRVASEASVSRPARVSRPQTPDLQRFLQVAEDLGRAAIRAQRSAGEITIDTKANPGDLVTEVDRGVEQTVRRVIGGEFGDHVVAGEEFGGSDVAADAEWAWYCDPVDGTTNFANGLRWSSFSLCLAHHGELVLGVVADPWRNEVISAVRGGGAHRDGVPLAAHRRDGLAGAVVLSELAGTQAWRGLEQLISGLAAAHCGARIMGSGTLALLQPASSRVAATVVDDFHVIDHGASLLIAVEAGCEALTWSGEPFPLVPAASGGGIVVAAPGAGNAVVDLLPH